MNDAPVTINPVEISFWLNGKKLVLSVEPELTALELLHEKLRLYGSKSSCNEGDCGACTVIIAQNKQGKIVYLTFNSCIYPAVRLHGKHLITVEGITTGEELHPVQTALLDEHGTQCGFCTPGFVMSILGLYLNNFHPTEAEILAALEGNLCRCTGYDSILKAARLAEKLIDADSGLLPPVLRDVEKAVLDFDGRPVYQAMSNAQGWTTVQYLMPQSLPEFWECVHSLKASGQYKFITGGTDLGVAANIQHVHAESLLDLCGVEELSGLYELDGKLYIGANTTLTELLHSELVSRHFPVLGKVLSLMASEQIRNSATLAGNIANASPVADGATALLALDAAVIMASSEAERVIQLKDFYLSYKQTQLRADELIKTIVIPLPANTGMYCDAIKSAKRKAVDISSVVSVICLALKENVIETALLSFGGVAPYPALATRTMQFIQGRELHPEWFQAAAELAQSEFTPLSDIRGKDIYRSTLIRNHVLKYLQDAYEHTNH